MKKYLITGLLVWVPLGITLWVLDLTIGTMDQTLLLLPEDWQPDRVLGIHIPGLGIILTLVVVVLTGLLMRNVFGQYLWEHWEKAMLHVPFVGSIYKGVKQVSDTLLSGSGNSFRKVLLVRYPHPQAWSLAFQTSVPGEVIDKLDEEYVAVFIPTTPSPVNGFYFLRAQSRYHNIGYDGGRGIALHRFDGRGGGFRNREISRHPTQYPN